jgi:multiple sugar transport system substrate-binding protein
VVLVNRWSEYLYGFGGQYVDDAGKCAMNQPKGVAALTYMSQLFQKGLTPKEALNWKEEDAYQRFFAGTKLFYTGRQGDMLTLDDPKQSKVVGKWDFIPNPAQAGGRHSGFTEFWGFAISKYSTHIDEDIKMLNLWGDTPTMKIYDLAWGPIQGNMDVLKDPDVLKANPNLPKVQAVAATALGPYPSTNYGQAADILQTQLSEALAGMSTPQKALDAACKGIDAIQPAQ